MIQSPSLMSSSSLPLSAYQPSAYISRSGARHLKNVYRYSLYGPIRRARNRMDRNRLLTQSTSWSAISRSTSGLAIVNWYRQVSPAYGRTSPAGKSITIGRPSPSRSSTGPPTPALMCPASSSSGSNHALSSASTSIPSTGQPRLSAVIRSRTRAA